MTCMILLITIHCSHFATKTVGPEDDLGYAMEERVYDLNEHNIKYLTHLPGDTKDDSEKIRQIEVLDDDLQSIEDEEYYKKRRQEELDDPEA
eukprot:5875573-Amphidinium_carterae.1